MLFLDTRSLFQYFRFSPPNVSHLDRNCQWVIDVFFNFFIFSLEKIEKNVENLTWLNNFGVLTGFSWFFHLFWEKNKIKQPLKTHKDQKSFWPQLVFNFLTFLFSISFFFFSKKFKTVEKILKTLLGLKNLRF